MRATKGSENVFVDCGFPPAEAENLRIRAKMMMALTGYIQERKITQSRAARIMGVSQPRISVWYAARSGYSQSTHWSTW